MAELSDPSLLIPPVDALLADPRLDGAVGRLGRALVREAVVAARAEGLAAAELVPAVLDRLPAVPAAVRPVLNATGDPVRDDLGRAPLSVAARAALLAAAGTADLELDLATGAPAARGRGAVEALRAAVPAAGDALVLGTGTAGLLLAAAALAAGREIALSLADPVAAGGADRIAGLVGSVGVRVGAAVGAGTAFLLTDGAVPGGGLSGGGLSGGGVPVVVGLRSGLLGPSPVLPGEPDAASALAAGAALVVGPADRLLGGPQAGLVLGRADLVGRLRAHPLARALRVDKLTLAALEASLRGPAVPVARALAAPAATVRARADRLATLLAGAGVDAAAVDTTVAGLPGAAVSLPGAYADRLRAGDPAVLGRPAGDRCLLELRTVEETDDRAVRRAVLAAHGA